MHCAGDLRDLHMLEGQRADAGETTVENSLPKPRTSIIIIIMCISIIIIIVVIIVCYCHCYRLLCII